jgi:hypothetical protein
VNTDTSITPLFLKDPEEGLRRSFNMDRAYCSFLFKSTACDAALRLLLLGSHASVIVALVQKGLREAVDGRFSPMDTEAAAFYTQALTIGIWQDVRLVGYLSLRGLSMESSAVVRRTLEHLGVLAHFWHAPEKAKVPGEDGDSDSYKDAFVNRNARAGFRGLKGAVKPRFAGLEEGSTVSTLYGLFSEFGVHGGSAKSALDYPGDNARSRQILPRDLRCSHAPSCLSVRNWLPCFRDLAPTVRIRFVPITI